MAALNYEELNARLCAMDIRAALVDYIWRTQGESRRRLNFTNAAEAVGCSVRTVGRIVSELTDNKILIISKGDAGGELQINPALVT